MAQSIVFHLKGDNVEIEAIGYSGPACEQATKEAEEALGVVVKREKKPEWYNKTSTRQEIRR